MDVVVRICPVAPTLIRLAHDREPYTLYGCLLDARLTAPRTNCPPHPPTGVVLMEFVEIWPGLSTSKDDQPLSPELYRGFPLYDSASHSFSTLVVLKSRTNNVDALSSYVTP